MSGSPAREPRLAVMILVDASWQDSSGDYRNVVARIENRSDSGACIRCKAQLGVGVRLQIRGRWESFSGVSKYCRSVGGEFLIGVQREKRSAAFEAAAAESVVANAESALIESGEFAVEPAEMPIAARRLMQGTLSEPGNTMEGARVAAVMELLRIPPPKWAREERMESETSLPQTTVAAVRSETVEILSPERGSTVHATTREFRKQGGRMTHKWLDVGQWGKKEGEADTEHMDHAPTDGNGTAPNGAAPPQQAKSSVRASEGHAPAAPKTTDNTGSAFPVELASMDDIYRAAGIMNPRRGYSITKVVEMLHSEHIRGLPKEMRRAAVLMALDAAEIPMEEVLRDARIRQEAIDKYEAEQRRQIEAEWARKTEENTQIQAELERVKAHYMDRIRRNVEGMAREKATFGNWLTTKQQESQSMAEAVELCLKPVVPEGANNSLAGMALPDASAKPV